MYIRKNPCLIDCIFTFPISIAKEFMSVSCVNSLAKLSTMIIVFPFNRFDLYQILGKVFFLIDFTSIESDIDLTKSVGIAK